MRMRISHYYTLLTLLTTLTPFTFGQKFEGLAKTPPMGWNSWNTFETNISEELDQDVAQAMIDSGMQAAGYTYIVLDDGWMTRERDNRGDLVPDPVKFPSGMKALADHLHAKGFKFGLYNCAGSMTCAGYPGSQGHEFQDARLYAGIGVDYLKYDWCHTESRDAVEAYTTMSRALRAAGRPVVFSVCEWGTAEPWKWAPEIAHLWRTTGDIIDCWDCEERWSRGIKPILDLQMSQEDGHNGLELYAGPDHWNDPDMMEVGNPGLTVAESRAHFSLWCILAAPLIAGNDVRAMSDDIIEILTNREAIAVNQDPLGQQGNRFYQDEEKEIWVRPLVDGDWAVCVLNADDDEELVELDFSHLAHVVGSDNYKVRDLWAHKDLGRVHKLGSIERELDSHDVMFLRLSK